LAFAVIEVCNIEFIPPFSLAVDKTTLKEEKAGRQNPLPALFFIADYAD
jgi:hypothetical protein